MQKNCAGETAVGDAAILGGFLTANRPPSAPCVFRLDDITETQTTADRAGREKLPQLARCPSAARLMRCCKVVELGQRGGSSSRPFFVLFLSALG